MGNLTNDNPTIVSRGKETFREDGKAVDVTYTGATPLEKGSVALIDGFHGILMSAASSGDEVALEIAQRVHEINVGNLAAAKGAILYLDSSGDLSVTTSDRPAFKVVKAKDANNIAWVLILPQYTDTV